MHFKWMEIINFKVETFVFISIHLVDFTVMNCANALTVMLNALFCNFLKSHFAGKCLQCKLNAIRLVSL